MRNHGREIGDREIELPLMEMGKASRRQCVGIARITAKGGIEIRQCFRIRTLLILGKTAMEIGVEEILLAAELDQSAAGLDLEISGNAWNRAVAPFPVLEAVRPSGCRRRAGKGQPGRASSGFQAEKQSFGGGRTHRGKLKTVAKT